MLIKEFISETNRNQMIAKILKYYGVGNVRVKHKFMKNHAHYEVEKGVLYLSKKYKSIKPHQLQEFLITIIHETYHAIDAKKYGWQKFRDMWETEANKIEQGHVKGKSDGYWDNPFEVSAEKFGQANWEKWKRVFHKDGLM